MWYVIQVINGREDVMRERIERMVPAVAMQELFYPQFQTEIKVHGEWVNTTKPLFPGYLICDTADPRTVQQYLLRMDDFARVLSQDGQFVPLATAIDRPSMYVILNHSYAIPVLFLTRHCMELAIKRAIRKCGREPKGNHGLSGLWNSLLSRFPEQRGREDRQVIKNMGAFVNSIADIDDNGISLRYPSYKSGKLTQDRPLFVNNEQVASYLEKFVEQLELIDFDSLKKD